MKQPINPKRMNNNIIQMGTHGNEERQVNDLYCTPPKALEKLLENEQFDNIIWECADGLGHISSILKERGYLVKRSDIVQYLGDTELIDFLQYSDKWEHDIITNPPYKLATEFINKGLEIIEDGHKIAMYLKINFLASNKRKDLFNNNPPKVIYVICKRLSCAKNGDFIQYNNGSVDYCWIVWEKGYKGNTIIKWI